LIHRFTSFPRHPRAYPLRSALLSVTHVLNHNRYLCSEPAPRKRKHGGAGLPAVWSVLATAVKAGQIDAFGQNARQTERAPIQFRRSASQSVAVTKSLKRREQKPGQGA
jgi:hypothetical protein